ncbi:hypothetical protein ACHAWT_001682 [Skeletonema menzelii]
MMRVVIVTAWIVVGGGICLLADAFAPASKITRRRTSIDDSITPQDSTSIPSNAYSALDLAPFLKHLKSYACTKRGEQSILALIPTTPSLREERWKSSLLFGSNRSSRRKQQFAASSRSNSQSTKIDDTLHKAFPIASSAADAIQEYKLVDEAMGILNCQNDFEKKCMLPPMFNLIDGDTGSDEDEWISLCIMNSRLDAYQEIDLETILQAECLVKLLLDTYNWTSIDGVKSSYPGLVSVVTEMSTCVEYLSILYNTIASSVEITRPKASLTDGNVYMFQLASGGRFPELDSLRDREDKLMIKIKGSKSADNDNNNHRQLAIIREERSILEQQTTNALIASMIDAAPHVQRAQDALARLDVIFARASYACEWDGIIPKILNESCINIKGFVHPVLALEKSVVPVDLFLSGQVLMISGPNAGGKTLSLKSFGLAACFVKLGIPVIGKPSSDVRVDFFDDIFIQIGDNQDLISGESTLMARLNACSSLIHKMKTTDVEVGGKLVLLDELGGGTDPFAGAALSTAILEKLCTDNRCKIVATTHSPQLKALSLDDERFQSASVLLEKQEGEQNSILDSAKMKPTFKLHYGFASESYPLGAASRCNPSLPDDVIRRAAELMSKGGDSDQTVEALRRHMIALEDERSSAKKLREEAQLMFNEVAAYKRDMVCKLQSSESTLSRLEARLQSIYETLKNDESRDMYDVVGDGLSSLRLLRKAVKSEEELLSEKGLRRVTDRHTFYENESVVIIAEGEFQWQNAVVRIENGSEDSSNGEDTITVVPSLDLAFGVEDTSQALLLVRRKDIAVWDIPDWGFQDEYAYGSTSYSAAKKSTSNVLEKLKQVGVTTKSTSARISAKTPSFTSARERKAAGKTSASKKNRKKK